MLAMLYNYLWVWEECVTSNKGLGFFLSTLFYILNFKDKEI